MTYFIHFFKNTRFSKTSILLLFLGSLFLVSNTLYAQDNKQFTVVLDAGHGGKDPGKRVKQYGNKYYEEKEVALKIVLAAGKLLGERKDIKVVYTRKNDTFVDLWERGRIANRVDADLFVSVHCNAAASKQAKGAETWVLGVHRNQKNLEVAKSENEVILLEENYEEKYAGYNPNSPESIIGLSLEQEENLDQSLALASYVQEAFDSKLKRVNRGVKQAGFVVLYQSYMPSVLIETGFLTNKIEGKYLYSKKGQKEMSNAIANSIKRYFNEIKLNTADHTFIEEYQEEHQKEIVNNVKEMSSVTYYKVQLSSSKRKVKTAFYNFKGLRNVEAVKVGDYYKYYYGKYLKRSEAELALDKAKKKGYTSAFISSFKEETPTIVPAKKEKVIVPVLEPIETTIIAPSTNQDVLYKVQISSGKRKITPKASNFRGIENIERVPVGKYYKYYSGKYFSRDQALKQLKVVKAKGYTSAFVAKFTKAEFPFLFKQDIVLEKTSESAVKTKESPIYFKVQLASSTKNIGNNPRDFKGLKEISVVPVGNYYKYYLGKTPSYERAQGYLMIAKEKQYSSAYIVAFENDKIISLKTALEKLKK